MANIGAVGLVIVEVLDGAGPPVPGEILQAPLLENQTTLCLFFLVSPERVLKGQSHKMNIWSLNI
jgi:hypothetical protein